MKYNVYANVNDVDYSATVAVRRDAKKKTVFLKCAEAIAKELWAAKAIPEKVSISWDLPNIWRNGYVGFLAVGGNVIVIEEENGATLAY